jgi:hypothetical protein
MSHPIRLFFEILGSLTALLLVGTGLLLWRLSAGPILVPFVTPMVEAALGEARAGLRIDIGETWIDWSDRSRSLELRVIDTRVYAPDGAEVARIPRAWMSLAVRRLLAGEIQPEEVRIDGLRLSLLRDAGGALRVFEGGGDAVVAQTPPPTTGGVAGFLVAELGGPADPRRPLGLLSTAAFVDATVTVEDAATGLRVAAEHADVRFRRDARGVALDAALPVRVGDQLVRLEVEALHLPSDGATDIDLRLRGVSVAGLAGLDPRLAALRGFETVVDLQLWTRALADGRVEGTHLTLDAGGGRIADPALFASPVPLKTLNVRARVADGLDRVWVDEAVLDFGGPAIRLSAEFENVSSAPRVSGKAALTGFASDDVNRLWPPSAAPNAREWVRENLSDGRVTAANAEFALRAADPNLSAVAIERAQLDFAVEGMTVRYIEGLPPVRDVAATARLDPRRLDIRGRSGTLGALRVGEASVALTGLDVGREQAAVDVRIGGPVVDALRVIDMKPLGFLSRIGETADNFSGNADIRLAIRFPLLARLRLDQLSISASADVTDFGQRRAVLGQPIENGTVAVKVDDRGLDVTGDVTLAGARAAIGYRREFAANAEIVERARARGRADPAAQARLGFDFAPYAVGPAGLDLTTESRRDGRREIALDLDLAEVAFAAPDIDWTRAPGTPTRARLRLELQNDVLRTVDVLETSGAGIAARGRVAFEPDGRRWRQFDLQRLLLDGRVDLDAFRFTRATGTDEIVARGRFADVSPFLADKSPPDPARSALAVDVALGTLRMGEGRELSGVVARGTRGPKQWETLKLAARTRATAASPAGGALEVDLDVAAGGRGILDAKAQDAGALLHLLDVSPNVVGGTLAVNGVVDPARADRAVAGKMAMDGFRVVNAPGFAKLLSVALLTGILDSLRGEGIGFDRFDADFAWAHPRVEIREGRMYGSALGITARGVLDLDADTVDVEGTLVPAYAVNSILGNIPLLGRLLVGERGSGVFAATYRATGPASDAQISMNPLSTLAPGFLRGLFNLFSAPSALQSDPPALPDSGAPPSGNDR